MKYLEDFEVFRGTGAANELGEDLETFLENYNPSQYPAPFNTTDIVILKSEGKLTEWGQKLKLLMIKRRNHPCIGWWALPGGFVDLREDLVDGAARELEEETGIKGLPLMQLRSWGDYARDPRWRLITTAFLSVIEEDIEATAGDDAAAAEWFTVELTDDGGDDASIYTLNLVNEADGTTVGAKVLVATDAHPLMPERHYTLLESDTIASDHAMIVVDALLYLKDKLQ